MRTQRLTQRSDCEPECFHPSILTQKSAPLVRLAYLTNGAQIWGVLIFTFPAIPAEVSVPRTDADNSDTGLSLIHI